MSTYSVVSDLCELPTGDAQKRAVICGKPATTTRTSFDVTFSACDACAAALDARQGPPKEPPMPLPAHLLRKPPPPPKPRAKPAKRRGKRGGAA